MFLNINIVPLHGYWLNGIVSSCISSYKCSHLLYEGKIYNRLQANLYMQKFHIHLLSKTLVSKIDKKKWSLVHGPKVEGHFSTILMYWIQRSWWFINPSNGYDSVARWIPPTTGFQGHLSNPYPGHRMETIHKKGLPLGRASVFMDVLCGNAWKVHRTNYYIL